MAALERVDDFNNSCDDVKSWLESKKDQLNRNPNDMKNLANLEKDLKPLQDKIRELEMLANKVHNPLFSQSVNDDYLDPQRSS